MLKNVASVASRFVVASNLVHFKFIHQEYARMMTLSSSDLFCFLLLVCLFVNNQDTFKLLTLLSIVFGQSLIFHENQII